VLEYYLYVLICNTNKVPPIKNTCSVISDSKYYSLLFTFELAPLVICRYGTRPLYGPHMLCISQPMPIRSAVMLPAVCGIQERQSGKISFASRSHVHF
jgi:hypothetical protein